ncbi:MAG: YicC family protein [Verrucomicrobia bacterium]|nr:YicC family protein [Verrucomicrobiota bacterium]
MNSMTGYGRGEGSDGILKVTTEIQSVNRRQSEIVINLPRGFDGLESALRKQISEQVSRGRLTVRFNIEDLQGKITSQNFNSAVAENYLDQLRQFATRFQLSHDISLGEIARLPGVFESSVASLDVEQFLQVFSTSLDSAMQAFLASRRVEGEHLREFLQSSVRKLRELVVEIRTQAPRVLEHHRRQLEERLRKAELEPEKLDSSRLAQEIVLIADRCDVSEELDRLESHFRKFDQCIQSQESQGRTLDFLAQEMFREINTTGSKANDAGLSHLVVQLKTELEKFREQAQNIE